MRRYVRTFPQSSCIPPNGAVLLAGEDRGLLVITALNEPVAHLSRLYVSPLGRRRGLGRALSLPKHSVTGST